MKVNVKRIIVKSERKDVITHQIASTVQCKLCSNILMDPYDCECCLQTFCGDCIRAYIKEHSHCPFTEFFSSHPFPKSPLRLLKKSSANITQLIASLRFKCNNKSRGCNAELTIDTLTDHDKTCTITRSNSSIVTEKKADCLIDTPPASYRLKGKEMSFRNVDKAGDYNNSDSLILDYPNECIQKQLIDKVDKIYEIVNSLLYCSKAAETPRFEKKNMPSSFSPMDKASDKSGSSETLFNIANELNVLNEKISSIESKITPFNLASSTNSPMQPKGKKKDDKPKGVSMFDSSTLNSISIGSSYMNCNDTTANCTIESSTHRGKPSSLKPKLLVEAKKNSKQIEHHSSFSHKELPKSNFNPSKSSSTSIKEEQPAYRPNISSTAQHTQNQMLKEELLASIDEKCTKDIKQYILELTLDNSNLFVQKIDEVLDKLSQSSTLTLTPTVNE